MQDYDLMFITDATGSMTYFVAELKKALPQIFDLVKLTNFVDRVSVLAFRDYCYNDIIEWSDWRKVDEIENLSSFVSQLETRGGRDTPEAVKTGLYEACKKVEKPTICILYVDAPPHHKYKNIGMTENHPKELEALGENEFKWLNVCNKLKEKQIQIFPIFQRLDSVTYPFYVSLAEITGGQCIQIERSGIVQATIGVVLNLAGVEFEYDKQVFCVREPDSFDITDYFGQEECEKIKEMPVFSLPKVDEINDIKLKIGNPCDRFQKSPKYRDLVFNVFKRLMQPDRVMAFTYNTMFGKLWREVCAQRKDPRRDELITQFGNTVTAVSDAERPILQNFLEETYNRAEEIEEIIKNYGESTQFFVIDSEPLPRKVLFEIGLSCAPSTVSSVAKLLTSLRVVNKPPDSSSKLSYVPLNMKLGMKFKLLPHLMLPGTMFNKRMSLIMAAISTVSGSILREDAMKYLNQNKGKWIDLTLPENNSSDFARLMMKVASEALTNDETEHFQAIVLISALKKVKSREIDVEVAYSSFKDKRPDHKEECKTCKQWRSFSMMLDESCVYCVFYDEGKSLEEPRENKTSWMCECQTCLVHYPVYNADGLKCRPKCHFCRQNQPAPFVECKKCFNKFLYQQSKELTDFVCAVCESHKERVGQTYQISVQNYIALNGASFIGMDIEDVSTFFDPGSKVIKMSAAERLKVVRSFSEIENESLLDHKIAVFRSAKPVWNVKAIQQQVFEAFNKPNFAQCMICFMDFEKEKLHKICGRVKKGCAVEACKPCLDTWYNQLAPGQVCQPAQLVCPYCKQVPTLKVVRKHNRRLCSLKNVLNQDALDPSFVHAWCLQCYSIKPAMRRECRDDNLEIVGFNCEDCVNVRAAQTLEVFKQCPKCNVMTEKSGGCNHIECKNKINWKDCNAHWCWVCETLSTYEDIYYHLSTVHGGYYGNEDEFDDEDFEENV